MNYLPHQVGFLVGICLPCYELLQKCIPETRALVEGSQSNLTKWSRMAQHNRAALDALNPPSVDSSKEEQDEKETKNNEGDENEVAGEEKQASDSQEEKDAGNQEDQSEKKEDDSEADVGQGKDEQTENVVEEEEGNTADASP
ncbi:hypothetical protein OS493_001051 [Desmophyllum pertusum]|uniref:Uncharacterized protein n=1 Tax=Desmophyllum pertusum TaxID=174260 RepID=A0A9W9ZV19_9CNID|nr:hypothetical protein OS493_001051 [Desmophyllum pertusum]